MLLRALCLAVVCCSTLFVSAGEIVVETVESKALDAKALSEKGIELKINVLLPDGYADSDKRYPVIYLLHGYGGNYTEWARVGAAEELKGIDAIVAMPEGDKSFYFNHYRNDKGRWEDFITKEVIGLMDAKYRTIASRGGRGISGLSMGGFGGMMLGLKHPELFASAASHSGAVGILSNELGGGIGERIREIFGPDGSGARQAYDPLLILNRLSKEKRPHIYLDCGSSDFLLEQNRQFVRELAKRKVAYEYREVPGAHDFAYWKRNVRYSVDRQLEALAAARAKAAKSPKAENNADAVVGTWKTSAETPNGETRDSKLVVDRVDGKLTAVITFGDNDRKMDRVFLHKSNLEMELDFDRDGQEGVIRVAAKLSGNKLQGRWSMLNSDDQEIASGEWSAEKKKAAKPKPAPSVAGSWSVTSGTDDGNSLESVLELESAADGKLSGKAEWGDGAESHELSLAEFKDSKLVIEVALERDGQKGKIRVEAKLDGDKLDGTWSVQDLEGTEYATGPWEAKRVKKVAKPKSAAIGHWDVEIVFTEDQKFAYEFRFEGAGDKASVVLVSPRSGEYKAKSVKIAGNEVSFVVEREFEGNKVEIEYAGKIEGDKASGTATIQGDGQEFEATWSGTRKK